MSAENMLKYCKVRKVKSISRAHAEDAGIDFYVPEDLTTDVMKSKIAVTNDDVDMLVDDNDVVLAMNLKPGQSVLIPSGIHVKIPHGYALIYMNKSGVASKKGQKMSKKFKKKGQK